MPTRSGRRASSAALAGRQGLLAELVADLSDAQLEALDGVLTQMLATLQGRIGHPDVVCRLCDRPACIAKGAVCPVSQAARTAEADQA